ncbi:uncharacterized protein LOC143184672 isoform X2 [Calliopsis andreniformis]|uniref:uncharacterized protein LOC143184672 isoform X2 n=1 Tax=Calliopsis andreniformis TaxID=337506 RepID=UPI003FCC7EB7
MSDENGHTSEETEAEMNAGNQTNEQSKSDTSMLNNGTEQPMLEDEEMPTYISVSSPSRRDDSDMNVLKHQERIPMEEDHSRSPYPSDDQGGGSVYVLSSGEESTHPYNEEDEEEYADSEDMDEMDLENEHENIMLEDEEEDDEEDEEDVNPLRLPNDDDEDVETDINVFRQNCCLQNAVVYPMTEKKQSVQLKYQHVESKVKQYIKDIKEQNRKSMEKRSRDQDYVTSKNHTENENHDTDQLKSVVTNKTIKDYAKQAIKDLQREENDDDVNSMDGSTQVVENGETNKPDVKITENEFKHLRRDSEMNSYTDSQNEKHAQNYDDRLEKRNGSVTVNIHHIKYQNALDSGTRHNNIDQSLLVNGHQQTPTLLNLRTLSYEEYMHGTCKTEQVEELADQKHSNLEKGKSETCNEVEMMNTPEIENSNTSCSLKIESVKSIRIAQEESENVNFVRINAENLEVMQLKNQLNQKDAQFNTLRNAYQKTLAENIKMKQELDALKKSLAKYENENKTRDTKAASVQTETTEPTSNQKSTTSSGEINNKISTSSVASTISSIDHWTDSAASPAISVKPPDVTSILNSDDSIVLTDGTPRRVAHPLSRAFITSSRILQTLSSITQGKTKAESPLVKDSKKRLNETSTDQLLNLEYNSPIQASSSKKRKATDMLGASTFAQPFKIPHTIAELEKKNHSGIIEADFNFSGEHISLNLEQPQNASIKSVDGSTSVEVKTDETKEQDDSVKCFIYREDENSKNRSFLIQAEESSKDKSDNEKNRIQECGPYLLGNLEVRMSEINGTISVWGKEISEEPTSDNEDDMEVSIESTEKRTCHCWQKTPQTRFNGSSLVCSTNKKQKIPLRLNRSNVSQCYHSSSLHAIKSPLLLNDINDKNTLSTNTCVPSCENCSSVKHNKDWSICKNQSSKSQEKLHSCCIHHTESIDKEYNCSSHHEQQKCDYSPNLIRDKLHSKGIRRSSGRNSLISDSNKHLHESITNAATEINELNCKYNTCRRSLPNMANSSSHSTKCCNNARDIFYTCKSSLDNIHNHNNSDRQTCRHSPLHDGEDDPLIPLKRSDETPETRQRRLSGKKVRGILMDLLRGCGDCRSNTSGVSKSDIHLKETPRPPQIKISRCPSPEPTSSNSTQCNNKCCHAYARRIESQLEEFRMEMERVRSRSDAILDMLNMLHSVDMN